MNVAGCPRVLYVQYANPAAYPPVEHGARLLAGAGCDVTVVGLVRRDEPLQFPAVPRVELDLVPAPAAGWRQKTHYARFSGRVLGWARRWRPTWIYVSDPLAAPAALAARRLTRARVIYHEHDSPDQAAAASPFMRAVLAARAALARDADLCVLPNAARAERFLAETRARRVETVWNCPLRDEVAGPRTSPPQARLRLLYHGSIVPSRLPMAVVDALARVESATLGIAGYETAGHPGYVAALLARARTRGLEDRVTWTGTLPTRTALLAHADGFDVGLALMPSQTADLNEQTMLGASNKPFDYLARGLALLVGDRPDWVETYVEAGVARRCQPSSIADIAAALRTFAEQPADTRAMGERGRQRILADWNYERTFARVVEVMARATQTAAAPATLHSPAGTDARRR